MTDIYLYNTKTRTKGQQFMPIDYKNVRMYVCGPTVYDRAHLGNARPVILFDVLNRLLRHVYGDKHVTYVRNFTDVDDKINARAAESGRSIGDITDETIQWFLDDMGAVGAIDPDHMPRATEYIAPMVAMIEDLIAKGHAYAAEGHVLFSVSSYAEYGSLSGRSVDDMIAGARVEIAPYKRDPMDFVLWKPSGADIPGWDSPWGLGRPGWHIECSAMAHDLLGEHFDIHGGGNDLTFPHHENEIAQSEAATGAKFANLWMHNGPLRIDNEKMSKSLGNFFTVREVLKVYDAEVLRHLLIASHYRSAINYSEQSLQQSESTLERFYNALKGLDTAGAKTLTNSRFEKAFIAAMDDDFNTAEAFAVLMDVVKEINRLKGEGETEAESANQLGALLVRLGSVLGVLQRTPENFLRRGMDESIDAAHIEALIAAREQARADKHWAEADRIRDELAALHVVVEDGARGGSGWRIEAP